VTACYRHAVAPPIGFAVLTHSNPGQVVRLVDRLRHLYGWSVPIVIHHDQRQCRLDPERVRGALLVEPSLPTSRGSWSLVEATLATLRRLHAGDEGPEFTVLLSGSDYPIATADRVLGALASEGADAYMHASPVRPWRRDRRVSPARRGLGVNEGAPNQEICFRRYYSTTLRWGRLRFRIRSRIVAPLLAPFSAEFRLFAGDQWWTLGRQAVRALLAFHEERQDLVRWFAERPIPDEAYIQTVVLNAPGIRVAPTNYRYLHWTNTPSPRSLSSDDLPRIAASDDHFARKFEPDDPILDALDCLLGVPPWSPALHEDATSGTGRAPAPFTPARSR
jgi:hypothetical protein